MQPEIKIALNTKQRQSSFESSLAINYVSSLAAQWRKKEKKNNSNSSLMAQTTISERLVLGRQ